MSNVIIVAMPGMSVAEQHKRYPFRLFLLLLYPSMAEVMKDEALYYDKWTAAFIASYGSYGWGSMIFRMALLSSLTIFDKLDTAQIESLHAYVRRWLKVCSTQTHTMTLEDVSAMDVMRQVKRYKSLFENEFWKMIKPHAMLALAMAPIL